MMDQYPFDLDLAFTFAFASPVVVARPFITFHHYSIEVQTILHQYFIHLVHQQVALLLIDPQVAILLKHLQLVVVLAVVVQLELLLLDSLRPLICRI